MKCSGCGRVIRRMRNLTLTVALLYIHNWISASGSQTVEVQRGEEVTLPCANVSARPTPTSWFRVVNRTKPGCVSAMFDPRSKVSFCDGFQNGNFEMTSNVSTVFLKIKQVDLSDSGLYFCGFYINGHVVVASATELRIQGNGDSSGDVKMDTQVSMMVSMILGGLTLFLTVVVVALAVKIRTLQTALNGKLQADRSQHMSSDDRNYAAPSFRGRAKRSRRPASETDLESKVVYAATR